jgi:hypothetical protein
MGSTSIDPLFEAGCLEPMGPTDGNLVSDNAGSTPTRSLGRETDRKYPYFGTRFTEASFGKAVDPFGPPLCFTLRDARTAEGGRIRF